MTKPLRPNLPKIDTSYRRVQKNWDVIDDQLDAMKIGRKDTRFDRIVRLRMMSAYEYLDSLLARKVEPFTLNSISPMLELNHRVHFGTDMALRDEYVGAMAHTAEKFHRNVAVLLAWHRKHHRRGDNPLKIAAEIYVGIIGQPQLYIEGNHRTGSLIASWINLYYGYPPFVLSPENAIPYFAPSSEIKAFANKTTWRGMSRLPKYRKSFRRLWEKLIDSDYVAS